MTVEEELVRAILDPAVIIPLFFLVLVFYMILRLRAGRTALWNLRLKKGKNASLEPVKLSETGLVHQRKSSYAVLPQHVILLDEGPIRGRLFITREDLPMPLVYDEVFKDVLPNGGEPITPQEGTPQDLTGWKSFLYPDMKTAQHVYTAVHEAKLPTLYGVLGGWEKWVTWGLLAAVLVVAFLF